MNVQSNFSPDFDAIKAKQNAAWASGDYSVVGTTLQIVGETLAEALDLTPGSKVLDVAAGNGNATLAFARRWNDVTSTDYVPDLLEKGRARAAAEGLEVSFEVADAEALPFADESFDAVVSTYGVMFTPNQPKAVAELLRVCKTGGSIGMANWTPDSFIGRLFKVLGRYVPPPQGVKSPALWGDEGWLRTAFDEVQVLTVTKRHFVFRYPSADRFVDLFSTVYGPVHKAFLALDDEQRSDLRIDIKALVHEFDTATDGAISVPSEYAVVRIIK